MELARREIIDIDVFEIDVTRAALCNHQPIKHRNSRRFLKRGTYNDRALPGGGRRVRVPFAENDKRAQCFLLPHIVDTPIGGLKLRGCAAERQPSTHCSPKSVN